MGKKNRIVALLLIVFSAVGICEGQYYSVNTKYIHEPMQINPAYAGGNGALNLSLFYGTKWIGMEGSPETIVLSADAPLFKQKFGLGMVLTSDSYEGERENQLRTNYAYRILMPNSVFSIGVGAMLLRTQYSFRRLMNIDQGEDIGIKGSKTYSIPNASFGLHYSFKNLFVGVSVPELLYHTYDEEKDQYLTKNDFTKYIYLLNAGYQFKVIPKIKLYPSVLVQYTDNDISEQWQYDVNTMVSYKDQFWLGGTYRNDRLFGALLKIHISKQMSFAYSYNFEIGSLNKNSKESHELMLRYVFKYKVDAPNPLIF